MPATSIVGCDIYLDGFCAAFSCGCGGSCYRLRVNDGLRTERLALPLVEAAVRLGISAEALRLRLERGEARGFERDGTSFVYVNDHAAERRFGDAAAGPAAGPLPDQSDGTLPVVIEFQKMELTRLLRENERLNARLDQLFDETRRLRDMQQREQVLRQQEQALRRQIQETLDRLTSRPALSPPPEPAKARPALLLTRTMAAKNLNRSRGEAARRPGPAFLATGRAERKVLGSERREPHAVMPTPVPGRPAARDFVATPAPAPAPAPSAAEDAAIRPEEAAELAEILNGIGRSLRDSEAFRRYPPIKPGSAPQRAGDRRPVSSLPGHSAAPRRATGGVVESPPAPKSPPAPNSLSEEESALHAILDSMGPTAEDRRNAARDLGRLLRKGLPPRAGEP